MSSTQLNNYIPQGMIACPCCRYLILLVLGYLYSPKSIFGNIITCPCSRYLISTHIYPITCTVYCTNWPRSQTAKRQAGPCYQVALNKSGHPSWNWRTHWDLTQRKTQLWKQPKIEKYTTAWQTRFYWIRYAICINSEAWDLKSIHVLYQTTHHVCFLISTKAHTHVCI